MKHSKQIKRIIDFAGKNWCYIILIAAYVIGIISGSLSNYHADDVSRGLLIQYAEDIFEFQSTNKTLINGAISNISYFFVIFIAGLSAAGFVIIFALPFIKGFSFGYTSAFIYSIFGARGIIVCALGIIPQVFISTCSIIIAARIAVKYSISILLSIRRGGQAKPLDVSRYFVYILVLFVISLATIVFDAFVTPNIINLFSV